MTDRDKDQIATAPDELLARVAHLMSRTGLSNRDVEWRSGIALGFLREARQGERRSARSADSWRKIEAFLGVWEPLVPRSRGGEPTT